MLRPVRMKKVQALISKDYRYGCVARLQELGVIQISDSRERLHDADWQDLVYAHGTDPLGKNIAGQILSLNKVIDLFDECDPLPSDGFFKTLFNPSPPHTIPVEKIDRMKLVEEVESSLGEVEGKTHGLVERLETIEVEIAELVSFREVCGKMGGIEVDLGYMGETERVSVFGGFCGQEHVARLGRELSDLTGEATVLETAKIGDNECFALVICFREDGQKVSHLLKRVGVRTVETRGVSGTPQDNLLSAEQKISPLHSERASLEREMVKLSQAWRDRLVAFRELLLIERDRAEIQGRFVQSESTIVLEGWVPEEEASRAADEVREACEGFAVVSVKDVEDDEERCPVLLKNPGFFRHFELLTRLYAPPRYNEIDPTVLLAPTFLLFFATMVTDAMYGLCTLVLGVLLLRGGGKYFPLYKSAGVVVTACGAATVVAGVLTGGWFGNLAIDYLDWRWLRSFLILDPMVDVSTFLVATIVIGVLHLNAGIVTGMVNHVRNGSIMGALQENFWFLTAQAGGILLYVNRASGNPFLSGGLGLLGTALLLVSLVLLVSGHKGMSFFSVTGMLGDSLSYARLMALGLCTAGIAMTVNMLATMTSGLRFLGPVLMILILFVGHLFNLLIQVVGAAVHGIRLHYVEFFGKFYQGGGEEFAPFTIRREVTVEKTA
jgi:V/A-type H+-transporting ATPase subunit I